MEAAVSPPKKFNCEQIFKSCAVGPGPKAIKAKFERQSLQCTAAYQANKCDSLKADLEIRSKIMKCDARSMCEQVNASAATQLRGCFWNAPKDFGVDILSMVTDSYSGMTSAYAKCLGDPRGMNGVQFAIQKAKCESPVYWVIQGARSLPNLSESIEGAQKIVSQGRNWIVKQGVKLDCYNPEAQAEMVCYGVISVFAPGAVAKVAGKIPKIVQAMRLGKEIEAAGKARVAALSTRASVRAETRAGNPASYLAHRESVIAARTNSSVIKTAAKVAPVPGALSARDAFSKSHVSKTFTTEAQNEKWVKLANQTDPPPGTQFFDVENSMMKILNDTTLDKNFVTALTNQHKEMVMGKMEALAKKYPEVEFIPYSDFKSVRYALKPKPPATKVPDTLNREISKAFNEVNKDFVAQLKEKKLVPEGSDPNWWFRAGWGDTADQATFASRYSRNAPSTNQMRRFTDADLRESQNTTLKYAEAYRMNVESSFKNTSLMEPSAVEGKMIPKAEVFDAIRKTETPEQLASFLKKTTGEDISVNQAKILRTYGEMTDEFSPGIHIARREQAILEKNTGGITFDLVGAGSENAQSTANALVRSKDVETAVREARIGEKSVTENLTRRKAEVQNTVSPILDKYKIKAKFVASGDDMAVIPEKPIPPAVKKEIAEALAKTEKPSSIRMSSVGEGIPNVTDRMVMATQGESVEKATRKYLQGTLPKEILDSTLISVQMEGKAVGQGTVRLVLGEGKSLSLEQRKVINSAFEKAVQDLKTNYKPAN